MALNMSAFTTTTIKEKQKTNLDLSAFGIQPVSTAPITPADKRMGEAKSITSDMIKSGQATTTPIVSLEPRENIFKKTLNTILNLPKKLQSSLSEQFKKDQAKRPKSTITPDTQIAKFIPQAIKETLQSAVGYTPILPDEPFAKLPLWRKITDVVAEVNPAIMQVSGDMLKNTYGFFASAINPTKEKVKIPFTNQTAPTFLGTYNDARKMGLSPLWATVLTTSRAAGDALIVEGILKGVGKIPVERSKITTLTRKDLMDITRGEEFAGKVDPVKLDAYKKLSQEGVDWNKALKDTGKIDVKTGKAKTLGEAIEEQASILKQNERGFAKYGKEKKEPEISKEITPLAQEATKLKSAEELLKDDVFSSGLLEDVKLVNPSNRWVKIKFNPNEVKYGGNLSEESIKNLDKYFKEYKAGDKIMNPAFERIEKLGKEKNPIVIESILENGKISILDGSHRLAFARSKNIPIEAYIPESQIKNIPKTKSQLTDIWNKANKGEVKIKTEADFRNFDDVNNYLKKHGDELSDVELQKYNDIANELYQQEEENAYRQTFGDIKSVEFVGEKADEYQNFKRVAKKLYGSLKKTTENVEDLGSMEKVAQRKGIESELQRAVYSQEITGDAKLEIFLDAIKKEYGYGTQKATLAEKLSAPIKALKQKKSNFDRRIKEFLLKQAPQLEADFLYSAKKVFRRILDAKALTKYGDEGKIIYDKIKKAEQWAIKKEAETITKLDAIFDKFLETDFKNFGDYVEGKKDIPDNALNSVVEWRKAADEIAQISVKEGVIIKNSEGIEHPFKPIKNYYPYFIKEDKLAEIFSNQNKYRKFLEDMAMENNITVAEAHKIIQRMVNNRTDFYGHLERAREARLPKEFYERDPRQILGQYIHGAYQRLGIIREFGEKDKILKKLIQTALEKGEDFEEIQLLADRALGKDKFNKDLIGKKVSNFARMYNNITKLSLAAITNLGDLSKPFIRTNFMSGMKGLVNSFTKEGKIFSRKSGVLDTQLVDYAKEHGLGNLFYKYTGFKWSETEVRKMMALASRNYINLLYKKLIKNPNNNFVKRRLEQFNINPDELLKNGLTEDDLITGAIKAIGDSQPISKVDLPYSWQSPTGKLLTQYKQFSYKQWQFAKEFIFKEAKKGNLKPLLMFIMVGVALGEAVADLKVWIRNRERPDTLPQRIIDNLMTIGGVGLATDFLSNLQYGSYGGGFLKFIAGPTLSDFDAWATAIQGDINTLMTDNKFVAMRTTNKGERQVKSFKKIIYSLPFLGPALANGLFPTRNQYKARTIPIAEEILQLMAEEDKKVIKPNILKPKINKPKILKPNK